MGANTEKTRDRLRNLERRDIVTPPFTGMQEVKSLSAYPDRLGLLVRTQIPETCCSKSLPENEERRQSKIFLRDVNLGA
jgi:hypothetical protein